MQTKWIYMSQLEKTLIYFICICQISQLLQKAIFCNGNNQMCLPNVFTNLCLPNVFQPNVLTIRVAIKHISSRNPLREWGCLLLLDYEAALGEQQQKQNNS